MKVIIADDERLIRAGLKSMLSEAKIPLDIAGEATNGEELVELVKRHLPEIAFVDIKMPKMNGLEAISKGKLYSPNTQWIILTGYAEFDYAREAIKLGAANYLLKPVSPDELNETLEVLIKNDIKSRVGVSKEVNNGEPTDVPYDMAEEVKCYIEQNYMYDIGINEIAEKLNVTPNYLSTYFHKKTGITFIRYLTEVRMLRAKKMLENPNITVQDVAGQVGYYSTSHFIKLFKEYFGVYPSKCQALF